MISFLLIFVLTAAISFIGSLQPGPVNMQILAVSLRHGKKAGRIMAFGGCLPELIYSVLALYASAWFMQYSGIEMYASWFIITIFSVMGISTLMSAGKIQKAPKPSSTGNYLATGFLMGSLNPLLFTYWFGVASLFEIYGLKIVSAAEQIAFITGTAAGAYILLISVVRLANAIRDKGFFAGDKRIAIVTGCIYLLIAMAEGIRTFIR